MGFPHSLLCSSKGSESFPRLCPLLLKQFVLQAMSGCILPLQISLVIPRYSHLNMLRSSAAIGILIDNREQSSDFWMGGTNGMSSCEVCQSCVKNNGYVFSFFVCLFRTQQSMRNFHAIYFSWDFIERPCNASSLSSLTVNSTWPSWQQNRTLSQQTTYVCGYVCLCLSDMAWAYLLCCFILSFYYSLNILY